MIADAEFESVLEVVRGHRVGLTHNAKGNVGDGMIERGALELFARHGIACRVLTTKEIELGNAPGGVTLIAETGGGNLGSVYRASASRRKALARIPLPKIILSQSAHDPTENLSAFDVVFLRERVSLELIRPVHRNIRFAPDLSLALRLPPSQPVNGLGVFLRDDNEAHVERGVDPIRLVSSTDEYLALAGSFRHIVTNRLHFAIAAALQGVRVTLRANSYHKNRAMFEAWLHRFLNLEYQG